MKQKCKKWLSCIAAALLMQPIVPMFFYAGTLPDEYYVRDGQTLTLSSALPITAHPVTSIAEASAPASQTAQASLRLFGILPIKTVEIQKTDEILLVPCGQAFGIRMLMDGIMVVEIGEVKTENGICRPAADAGLREGDIIRTVGGKPIDSTESFRSAACTGAPLQLSVLREDKVFETQLTPVYSVQQECWQTGIWVRDSTAGIGTLTYYEPSTGCFGGLGHPICDPDTGKRIPLAKGEADSVTISGARRGQPGVPGQLRGYFSTKEPIGTLSCNERCGLFGTLSQPPSDAPAIPMAFKQEITTGEAVILSTVTGDTPQAFSIEIESIDYTSDTQNMVIEVTDEALLRTTGGIVQGMSGSPILQDGRLVGAVTHVFVGEPSKGYGIFAETMYEVSRSTSGIQ